MEFTGIVYIALCEGCGLSGEEKLVVLSTSPYEDESCVVTQMGVFSGKVTGEIAKTLAETGVAVLGDE